MVSQVTWISVEVFSRTSIILVIIIVVESFQDSAFRIPDYVFWFHIRYSLFPIPYSPFLIFRLHCVKILRTDWALVLARSFEFFRTTSFDFILSFPNWEPKIVKLPWYLYITKRQNARLMPVLFPALRSALELLTDRWSLDGCRLLQFCSLIWLLYVLQR